jgi:hypothetical protein
LTDHSTNQQPDRTPVSSIIKQNRMRDKNDIVRRTSLPLPSLPGLEQTSLTPIPQERATEPISPVSKREGKITSQLTRPSTTEQEAYLPDPLTDTKDARLQPLLLPPTTENRLRAVPARPVQKPGTPSALPSPDQKTTGQNIPPLKRIRLRPILLIGLLCLSILGTFAYIHPFTTTLENSSVSMRHQNSSDQQENNSLSGTRTISVGAYPSIMIKGHRGNVTISAGSTGSVVVRTNSNGKNSNSKGIQYTKSRDEQGHDFINIVTKPIYSSVNYSVSAPSTASVKVAIDSGSISVDGISGVSITTSSGSLEIENVNGPIQVSTENGDITVHNVKGKITLAARNGSIKGNNVNGQLTAITHNGDVTIKQTILHDQSVLKTQQGSVHFTGTIDPTGTYTMETQSGDVDLILPALVTFQLHASTRSGSISNAFGNQDMDNTPQAQIIISIGSGSVTVKRAA